MAIHAHKRGNESNDGLLSRWKKNVQQTGLMKILRGRSTFSRSPNKRLIRNKAIKREEYRQDNRKKRFYSNM